jgi:hypothetical protein
MHKSPLFYPGVVLRAGILHLLKAGGGVDPYFVYRYDPRRGAASEHRFRASSSSPPMLWEVPAWPIWPPPHPIEELLDIPKTRTVDLCVLRRGKARQGQNPAAEVDGAGEERAEGRSGYIPHRPLRPPNIAVYAGWMQALHPFCWPVARCSFYSGTKIG